MVTMGKDAILLIVTEKGGELILIMQTKISPGLFYIGKHLVDIGIKQVLQ